jgi:hypothetical protein
VANAESSVLALARRRSISRIHQRPLSISASVEAVEALLPSELAEFRRWFGDFDSAATAKLLIAMRSNPLVWQLAQLQTVAVSRGSTGGTMETSHCVFVRTDGKTLPDPARRPIKPIDIRKFLELVEGA